MGGSRRASARKEGPLCGETVHGPCLWSFPRMNLAWPGREGGFRPQAGWEPGSQGTLLPRVGGWGWPVNDRLAFRC